MKAEKLPFEIVFISSDKDEKSANEYFTGHHADYYMLDFTDSQREALGRELNVRGIPHLALINSAGEVKGDPMDCRKAVIASYQGKDISSILDKFAEDVKDWTKTEGFTVGSGSKTSDTTPATKEELRELRIIAMQKAKNKKKLLEMGFDEDKVKAAIDEFGVDFDKAVEKLTES